MKRLLVVAAFLTTVLVIAIAMKLRAQSAELSGPSGGSGVIEGTRVDIGAQVSARVLSFSVKKGQNVKAGQLLFKLDCAEVDVAISEAEAKVAMAEAQYLGANASRIAAKRSTGAAWAQAVAAKTRGDVIDTRRANAERNVQRLSGVGDGVAQATLEQTQVEASSLALEKKAALEVAKATAAQAGVVAAQGNAAEAAESAAMAALNVAKSALSRALLLKRECAILAPRDGVIEEIFVEVGEIASRAMPVLRLVDLREVKIVFYLPNAELGVLANGDKASVVVDAYPKERFEGRVTSVSMGAAFTPRNIQTRSDRDRLVYPIEVTLGNPLQRLRPGMPADVRLNRSR